MYRARLAFLIVLLSCSPLSAAGLAFNENFSVLTPDQTSRQQAQELAEQVLAQADEFRHSLAVQWLGEPLDPGSGRTVITVAISNDDRAITWPIDNPKRSLHRIYLRTSVHQALGSALKHEIVHTIMATKFEGGLPAWLEEGIASRYDDPRRIAKRRSVIDHFAQTEQWPQIARVVTRKQIPTSDIAAYSIASSVTDFLLSRGDKRQLVKFGVAVGNGDSEQSLHEFYGFKTVGELQTAWQQWVRRSRPL